MCHLHRLAGGQSTPRFLRDAEFWTCATGFEDVRPPHSRLRRGIHGGGREKLGRYSGPCLLRGDGTVTADRKAERVTWSESEGTASLTRVVLEPA
eukprot:g31452.t1